MAKESENGFQFHKPVHRTKWEQIQRGVYNSDTRELCGRTGKSWGQLLAFYTIFYIVLAALFAICMQGLLATISDKEPKWTLEHSLIGINPGLGFRPISNKTEEGSLIWYNPKNETSLKKWTGLLDVFLKDYIEVDTENKSNLIQCDFGQRPNENQSCLVDIKSFGPCSNSDSYGYNTESPCVFLKLNRIFGWEPEYYTEPVEDMPEDLKKTIMQTPISRRDMVWISCNGEGPVDKENVKGFQYYPTKGFASYYYPYKNVKNYLSPLIAVRVLNPIQNMIVSIECRAWAKNINYHGGDLNREGSIHFEIMVDTLKTNSTTS